MRHIQTTTTITRDPCQEANPRNDIMFFSNRLPCTYFIRFFIISFLHLRYHFSFCNDREIFIYNFANSIIIKIKEVRLGRSFVLFYPVLYFSYIFISPYSFVMVKRCLFTFSLGFFANSIIDEIWKEVRSIINRLLLLYFYFSRIFYLFLY